MSRTNELMPWGRPSSFFPLPVEGFGSFASFQEEMNRFFENFYGFPLTKENADGFAAPSINIIEDSKSIKVEAELAGIEPKNVEVEIAKGSLTLKGEKKQEEKQEGKNYIQQEISYGAFVRTVALPETADSDKAKATFKNGLLTIEIPKMANAQQKPKKIEIKAEA